MNILFRTKILMQTVRDMCRLASVPLQHEYSAH